MVSRKVLILEKDELMDNQSFQTLDLFLERKETKVQT